MSWNDFSVNFNSETKNGSCAAPDGKNWCAFDDSRVKTGGEVGSGTVYFMWDAKQGGGFAYPYVDYASFDVHTGPATSVSESQIWNGSLAWAFPGMGVKGRGALGVSLQAGGGTFGYPGSQFLINDDVSGGWSAQFLDSGSHSNTRWGDFLTAWAATATTRSPHPGLPATATAAPRVPRPAATPACSPVPVTAPATTPCPTAGVTAP